ncbi:MAG: hypothetical protein H6907_07035 [Hyphomicrobiales bacterium]|nr:hypothetical protein [Hyphomicrobiales bacterium]
MRHDSPTKGIRNALGALCVAVMATAPMAFDAAAQPLGADAAHRQGEVPRMLSQIGAQRAAVQHFVRAGDRVSSALLATYEHATRRWRELSDRALDLNATIVDLERVLTQAPPQRGQGAAHLRRLGRELASAQLELDQIEDMAAAYEGLRAETLAAMADGPVSDNQVAELDRLLGLDRMDMEFASGPDVDEQPPAVGPVPPRP